METMKEMDGLAQRCLDACISQGWSREWQEVGAYLGLECAEYIEEVRRGDKQNIAREAADVLFVLFSSLAKEGVSMWDVLAKLVSSIDTALYDAARNTEKAP